MKVETTQSLAFRRKMLTFSKQEQAALLRASKIAEEARELMRQELGVADAEAHTYDLYLAEVEHNPAELVEGIELSADERLAF